MDKQLKDGTWRGEAQQPWGVPSNLPMREFFVQCDPHVIPEDAAWSQTISFKPKSRTKRVRIAATTTTSNKPEIDERIIERVPEWRNVVLKRAHTRDGGLLLLPEGKVCPLKEEATDEPAFRHGKEGCVYILVDAMGTCRIRCHICTNKELTIEGPPVETDEISEVLEKFNRRFAMLSGDTVLEYPILERQRKIVTLSQDKFVKQETLIGEQVTIDKKKISWPKLWLQLPGATRYPFGLICDPSYSCDGRFYNTYQGINPVVAHWADTFRDVPAETLRLEYLDNWFLMVEQNICGGDLQAFDYLLDWMADCVQFPHLKRGVALVFTGDPGAGKGLTGRMLVQIFGEPHGLEFEAKALVGNWNAFFMDAVVIYADESAAATDDNLHNRLKTLITESRGLQTQRYHDETVRSSFQHFIISSNDPPVRWQAGERRFAIFDAKKRLDLENPTRFFDHIDVQILHNPKALGAMLSILRNRNVKDWIPMAIPVTRATFETQYASFSVEEKYIYHVLLTGDFIQGDFDMPPGKDSIIRDLMRQNAGLPLDADLPIVLSQIGHDIFEPHHKEWYWPKELLIMGLRERFPNAKPTQNRTIGKILSVIFAEAGLYESKQVRVGANKINVFKFGEQKAMRERFCAYRGHLDARIFETWQNE